MNEHGFIRQVHKHLSPQIIKWKVNDRYTGGVPDAVYIGPKKIIFVEYKYLKTMPKRLTKVKITKLQEQWINQVNRLGHTYLLVVGCDKYATVRTGLAGDSTYVGPADFAGFFNAKSVASKIEMECGLGGKI